MMIDGATTVSFDIQVALVGARLLRADDQTLAYIARDASDALAAAIGMGRADEPSARRYFGEIVAVQEEQTFRARLAAALAL